MVLSAPLRRIAPREVGNEQRDVDHDVAVEDSGPQLHVTGVGSAGFLLCGEIVYRCEIVYFSIQGMGRKRMGNVQGRIDTSQDVRSYEAAKQGAVESRLRVMNASLR